MVVAGENVGVNVKVVLEGVCDSQQVFHDEALEPSSFFRTVGTRLFQFQCSGIRAETPESPDQCVFSVCEKPPACESLPNPVHTKGSPCLSFSSSRGKSH